MYICIYSWLCIFRKKKSYEEAIELYVAGGHIADFIHMMCSVLYL